MPLQQRPPVIRQLAIALVILGLIVGFVVSTMVKAGIFAHH
jgi:hypothetical protein